ncbi:hypothetical protein B0J13DRAFT_660054, partial [Dactylonectria estremocensis]
CLDVARGRRPARDTSQVGLTRPNWGRLLRRPVLCQHHRPRDADAPSSARPRAAPTPWSRASAPRPAGASLVPLLHASLTPPSPPLTSPSSSTPTGSPTDPTDVAVAVTIYKRLRVAFASDAMKGILADDEQYFPDPRVHANAILMASPQLGD